MAKQFNLISSILRGQWMIHPDWMESHRPMIDNILHKPASYWDDDDHTPKTPEQKEAERLAWQDSHAYVVSANLSSRSGLRGSSDTPKGSIGVINIQGPITKYDGYCDEPGMRTRTQWLNQMMGNDNIDAVVLNLNTPGGEARAAYEFSEAIQAANKPVLSFVDEACYSLGMWFSSASNETYLSHKRDGMGSIGVLLSYLDFSGYYEKNGIKKKEVYADGSEDKNDIWRELDKGNDQPYKDQVLNPLRNDFVNHVANSREAAKANKNKWQTGKTFMAKDAIDAGLADGIMSFQQVVNRAALLARTKKNK